MNNYCICSFALKCGLYFSKSYTSSLLITFPQRTSPQIEKLLNHNCLLVRCYLVERIRHDTCLSNVTMFFCFFSGDFLGCYTDKWMKTCHAFFRRAFLCLQARLSLRRNCAFHSTKLCSRFDARPPCGSSHCAFARAGMLRLESRKSAVKAA